MRRCELQEYGPGERKNSNTFFFLASCLLSTLGPCLLLTILLSLFPLHSCELLSLLHSLSLRVFLMYLSSTLLFLSILLTLLPSSLLYPSLLIIIYTSLHESSLYPALLCSSLSFSVFHASVFSSSLPLTILSLKVFNLRNTEFCPLRCEKRTTITTHPSSTTQQPATTLTQTLYCDVQSSGAKPFT